MVHMHDSHLWKENFDEGGLKALSELIVELKGLLRHAHARPLLRVTMVIFILWRSRCLTP